jgi:hypothetical protein
VKDLIESTKTAKTAVLGVVILQLLLAYFSAVSLNTLWRLLNGVSFIVFLPLINLTFPANFYLFNSELINIATFDIFPKIDEFNEFWFTTHYSEGEIENPAIGFSLLDFETNNFMKNTGSLYIFGLYFIAAGTFHYLFKRYFKRTCSPSCYERLKSNKNINSVLFRFVF